MWIICENGTAVNSDHIRLIYVSGSTIRFDCGTMPDPIVTTRGGYISDIVKNILSGEKLMDFREVKNHV